MHFFGKKKKATDKVTKINQKNLTIKKGKTFFREIIVIEDVLSGGQL